MTEIQKPAAVDEERVPTGNGDSREVFKGLGSLIVLTVALYWGWYCVSSGGVESNIGLFIALCFRELVIFAIFGSLLLAVVLVWLVLETRNFLLRCYGPLICIAVASLLVTAVLMRVSQAWPYLPSWPADAIFQTFRPAGQEHASDLEFLGLWIDCFLIFAGSWALIRGSRRGLE